MNLGYLAEFPAAQSICIPFHSTERLLLHLELKNRFNCTNLILQQTSTYNGFCYLLINDTITQKEQKNIKEALNPNLTQ